MKKRGHFLLLNRIIARMMGILPKIVIKFIYNRLKNTPGYIGLGLRYACLKNITKECGDNVAVFPGCVIKHLENLSLGNNVSIHHYCFIDAMGGISIGNDVSIANHSSLISFGHTWTNDTEPIKYNKLVKTPINISDDVWIGCGVRIIGPCIIKSRTIIAAGAVAKGILHCNSIYGGIPVKLIKSLKVRNSYGHETLNKYFFIPKVIDMEEINFCPSSQVDGRLWKKVLIGGGNLLLFSDIFLLLTIYFFLSPNVCKRS